MKEAKFSEKGGKKKENLLCVEHCPLSPLSEFILKKIVS